VTRNGFPAVFSMRVDFCFSADLFIASDITAGPHTPLKIFFGHRGGKTLPVRLLPKGFQSGDA
jgi:hypothetical protein